MKVVVLLAVLSSSAIAAPIIGGTPSPGEQPTVLLASYPADRSVLATCTAVLVSPTVLLTAAHCVDAANHPNYIFGMFTGDDATAYTTLAELEPHLVPVAMVAAHPSYNGFDVADLGVAVLAAPTTITPVAVNRAALDATVVGKTARIVGYGQIVYQQPNQRRYEATTTVAALEPGRLVVGDSQRAPCLGDSGGGVFVDGVLLGIDSYGPVGCGGAARYQRTDTYAAFIDQYAPPPGSGPDAGPTPGGPDAGTDPAATGDGGGCSVASRTNGAACLAVFALVKRRRRKSPGSSPRNT